MLRVNGGPAHSGTVVKRERGGPWSHQCPGEIGKVADDGSRLGMVTLPGYWASCADCGTKRP